MTARTWRVVLADDGNTGPVAIGPVFTDKRIEIIRDEVEARGWTLLGEAREVSFAKFRAETGDAR